MRRAVCSSKRLNPLQQRQHASHAGGHTHHGGRSGEDGGKPVAVGKGDPAQVHVHRYVRGGPLLGPAGGGWVPAPSVVEHGDQQRNSGDVELAGHLHQRSRPVMVHVDADDAGGRPEGVRPVVRRPPAVALLRGEGLHAWDRREVMRTAQWPVQDGCGEVALPGCGNPG